jgi:hypothetical protein
MRGFLETADEEVRKRTREAFDQDLELADRLRRLAPLPGFGTKDAVASTVLAAWDPEEFAVVDKRARDGLRGLRLVDPHAKLPYPSFLGWVIRLRDGLREQGTYVSARDVDKALWVLGGDGSPKGL